MPENRTLQSAAKIQAAQHRSRVFVRAGRGPRAMRAYPLFRRGSLAIGAARAIDFFGVLSFLRTPLGLESNRQAISDDWRAVGEDLASSLERFRVSEEPTQLSLFE